MSRGLGRREIEILSWLKEAKLESDHWIRLISIAEKIIHNSLYENSPYSLTLKTMMGEQITDMPEYQSIKRAAKSLQRKGYINRRSRGSACWIKLSDAVTG